MKRKYHGMAALLRLLVSIVSYSIDATNSESACRMVNDAPSKQANTVMKVIPIDGNPHLCLFARKNISKGEELRYDYGDKNYPWRTEVRIITYQNT